MFNLFDGGIIKDDNPEKLKKILNKLKPGKLSIKTGFNKVHDNNPDIPFSNEDPLILLAYKVYNIEFSEVLEPEPLP